MSSELNSSLNRFNVLTTRERFLFSLTLLVTISIAWWYLYAQPARLQIKTLMQDNDRISNEVTVVREAVKGLRVKIAGGVNQDKQVKLAQMKLALEQVEEDLRLKTIELIDPEKMFQLMTQLVYKDSRLKLLSLKRREVKPAIALSDEQADESSIYRHVLEVKFSGRYPDILKYMQTLEGLDWKLIWDEVDIVSDEYPKITVKVVISTLSTRKEWVGV
jgi:MSHA biogenesis protein MshJ